MALVTVTALLESLAVKGLSMAPKRDKINALRLVIITGESHLNFHGLCLIPRDQVYITFDMPNQRAKNKSMLGAFVDTQLKNRILRLARSRNTTASTIVCEALRHYLDLQEGSRVAANLAAEKEGQASPPSDLHNSTEEIWLL
jgi:predicted transcriptional regulator